MAIAFFVDPEYGPLPTSQQQPPPSHNNPQPRPNPTRGQNNRRGRVNVEIDENNNHVIPDLIHGVANFPMGMGQLPSWEDNGNQVSSSNAHRQSFVTQLSLDWFSVERLLSRLFRRNPAQVSSDGGSIPRGYPANHADSRGELPDVVQSHHGFSIDLSFERSRVFGSRRTPAIPSDDVNDTPRRRCRRPAGNRRDPIPLPPDPSRDEEAEDEWELKVAVHVNEWKQVGADLRRIGDQFAFEFESSIQRQRSQRRESFRVRCILRLATLPTLAVVGLVTGVAYLRRHL